MNQETLNRIKQIDSQIDDLYGERDGLTEDCNHIYPNGISGIVDGPFEDFRFPTISYRQCDICGEQFEVSN